MEIQSDAKIRTSLADEFPVEMDYFRSHEAELLAEYAGMHIVIRGVEVVASYETAEQLFRAIEEDGLLAEPGLICLMVISPVVTIYDANIVKN